MKMRFQRFISLVLTVASIHYAYSQNQQLLFGFNDIPQSVLINPSTTLDNNWFAGFPLLSHFQLNAGSSGVSVYDLFADDSRDFNAKLQNVIFNLEAKDFFTVNQQLHVFLAGFAFGPGKEKENYLSFGMYMETDGIVYYPKDYAILAYEGNASNIDRVFDLSDFNVSGEVLSVFHLGVAKKMNDKLTLGARGKIYSSVFNVSSTKNRGSFITQQGQNNFLIHRFDLDINLRTSGVRGFGQGESSDDIRGIRKRILLGGNLGLGLDLGFTYQATKQLTFEGSLLDFGFVKHTKDLESYNVNGNYTFEGINPIFPEVGNEQSAEDYWNAIADNFEDTFEIEKTNQRYTTWRPLKLNAAVRYAFGEILNEDCDCRAKDKGYSSEVGAQLYAINRPRQPQLALTAYYYRRLFEGFKMKASYTVDSFSYTNVGLGVSAHLGPLNVYLLADNLLEYQNLAKAQSASLQFGLNLIFGSGQ